MIVYVLAHEFGRQDPRVFHQLTDAKSAVEGSEWESMPGTHYWKGPDGWEITKVVIEGGPAN